MLLKDYIEKLDKKEITPKQLVEESINKIEEHDTVVNAVVNKRYEKALEEAERDYSETVFKGIPILIKSLGQNMKDEPSTAASALLKDFKAEYTDNFVQKILDLGFIILGQTNSPEFGFKNISDSDLYGSVRNPLNTDKTPGGSSGGSAAALVADYVPVVAASDGGGSIRIPASYTGLVGLKPTRGSMPSGPYVHRGWQGASINFFLTHTVEDSELLFDYMKQNTVASPFNYVEGSKVYDKKLKIAYTDVSPVNSGVSQEAKDALSKTISILEDLGHQVDYVTPEYDGMKLMEYYYMVNGVETVSMVKGIEKGLQRSIEKDDIELMSWALYQYGLSVEGWEMVEALNFWDLVSEIMFDFHKDYDVLLMPTNAKPAPDYDHNYHSEEFMKRLDNVENDDNPYSVVWDMFEDSLSYTPFTMLANITGQPAISLPVYETEDGSQMGVQFMANKGEEKLLLQLSKEVMKNIGE